MVKAKKDWYPIMSPETLGNKQIGETMTPDDKTLIGRTIKVMMNELAPGVKPYSKAILEVFKVTDGKARTQIKDYEVLRSYLFRSARKGSSKIISMFNIKDKNGKPLRVKGFAVTAKKIQRGLRNQISKKLEQEFIIFSKDKDFENIILMLSTYKPQKGIAKTLSKIYPVKNVEINRVHVLVPKKKKKEKKAVEQKEEKK